MPFPHLAILITRHVSLNVCILFTRPRYMPMASIINQTYEHWTLLLIGDGLNSSQTDTLLKSIKHSGMDPKKVLFRNLPLNETVRYIYKEKKPAPCVPHHTNANPLWCHIGTTAWNYGFKVAGTLPYATHIAWMSDDDYLLPEHLHNAVKAYEQYPNAVSTFSRGIHMGKVVPAWRASRSKPNHTHYYRVAQATPRRPDAYNILSSSWTWKISHDPVIQDLMQLKLDYEQTAINNHYGGNHRFIGVRVNDANLAMRIETHIIYTKETNFSIFIPNVDTFIFPDIGKEACLQFMNSVYESDPTVAANVIDTCHGAKSLKKFLSFNEYNNRTLYHEHALKIGLEYYI